MAEWISSRKNEQVKAAAKLGQSASFRRQTGLFLAEGARLCADAVYQPRAEIRQFFCTEHAAKKYQSYLTPILASACPPFSSRSLLRNFFLKRKATQGVFCVCRT